MHDCSEILPGYNKRTACTISFFCCELNVGLQTLLRETTKRSVTKGSSSAGGLGMAMVPMAMDGCNEPEYPDLHCRTNVLIEGVKRLNLCLKHLAIIERVCVHLHTYTQTIY